MSGIFWERFDLDPRRPENAGMRAGDRDRDVVADLLGTAYAEGRLDREELDERTSRLTSTKALGDLPALVDDLVLTGAPGAAPAPTGLRSRAEQQYLEQRRRALTAALTPTLICWLIWVAALAGHHGTWFPWPLFVMLGTGRRLVQLTTNRESVIQAHERSMQRREDRQAHRAQHLDDHQRRREARRLAPPAPEQG